MNKFLICASLLFLTACATVPDQAQLAKQAELNRTVPICKDAADCATKWDAAQLWIIHNAG
jgi:starvation-inducible outer membrane lipoprotein